MDVSDNIFPYGILLIGCKRLKSQEDTDKLYNIKHDIFVKNISVDDLIEKYFRCTDDITSLGCNIACLKCTCKTVSGRTKTEYVNMNVERD